MAADFEIYNFSTWTWAQTSCWCVVLLCGLELLSYLVNSSASLFKTIPVRGKPLENLSKLDLAFIMFNKSTTVVFTYHMLQFAWLSDKVLWASNEISLLNMIPPLFCFFLIYDFFYTLFHRTLHFHSIYDYIHKHHHRQQSPIRGNSDAVNVHPFEFVAGEYNHLLAVYLTTKYCFPVHAGAILLFIIIGGALASFNHTRSDFAMGVLLYDAKVHDVHHRKLAVNFGQYTMFWDRIMGSYRAFDIPTLDKTK